MLWSFVTLLKNNTAALSAVLTGNGKKEGLLALVKTPLIRSNPVLGRISPLFSFADEWKPLSCLFPFCRRCHFTSIPPHHSDGHDQNNYLNETIWILRGWIYVVRFSWATAQHIQSRVKLGMCQNKIVKFLRFLTISGKKKHRNIKMTGFKCFISTRPRHFSFIVLTATVAETTLGSILN